MNPSASPPREYSLDWLRAFAVMVILLFHGALYLSTIFYQVKSDQTSAVANAFVIGIDLWVMPLFFLISGMSTFFALRTRSAAAFIRERMLRLLVPLVFGTLVVIVPLQVYLERLQQGAFSGSFWEFYPHYFDGWYGSGGNFPWTGMHLWYLEFLFVFSLAFLPLFIGFNRRTALRDGLARFFARPLTPLLGCVPMALAKIFADQWPATIGREDMGGWSPLVYAIAFVVGYGFAAIDGVAARVERDRLCSLVLAIVVTLLSVLLFFGGVLTFNEWYAAIPRAVAAWLWIVTIMGYGRRYLNRRTSLLASMSEAVLPFYILHQPVLLSIGFVMAPWHAALVVKFLVLVSSSFAGIMLIYELAVRRWKPMRFLFGMK
jgi:glucans biosynthesis protein C